MDTIGSHSKWIVRIVSAGIISLLGYLLINDRTNFNKQLETSERRISAIENLTVQLVKEQEGQRRESEARWDEIKRSLARIESKSK